MAASPCLEPASSLRQSLLLRIAQRPFTKSLTCLKGNEAPAAGKTDSRNTLAHLRITGEGVCATTKGPAVAQAFAPAKGGGTPQNMFRK